VLGNDDPITSVCGEIVPKREFYDYVAKYADQSTELNVPADIPAAVSDAIRELAQRAFRCLDCAGMARVDFLVTRDLTGIYLNEVNTIPGFTNVSMYARLFEASGVSYSELLDRLIALALERHADRSRTKTSWT
jgi:D-alanine-D-alanine ligase